MLDNSSATPSQLNCFIPRVVMNCALDSSKLNICHLNAQSICARQLSKFNEFKICFSNSKVSIICVTESWLTDNIPDELISLEGYNLIRNDRKCARGGGILVYYKSNLTCKILTFSKNDTLNTTEFLLIEIHCNREKFLLGVFYNPPRVNCSEIVSSLFSEFSTSYENVVIVGDFNTDISKSGTLSDNFLNAIDHLGICCVNSFPTHFHSGGCSLLDLFLTNNTNFVHNFNQVSAGGFSKHDMIFASLNLSSFEDEIYYFRDYNNVNLPALIEAVNSINWSQLFSMNDPDIALDYFNQHIRNLFNRFIHLRKYVPRKNSWFNNNIMKAMIERDLAYNIWKTDKNFTNYSQFKRLRNKVTHLINEAKSNYVTSRVDSSVSSKDLWNKLKQLNISNKSKPDVKFPNSNAEINNYFTSNFTQDLSHPPILPRNNEGFRFSEVNVNDIINAINSVKSNAVGMDDIPIRFIKLILPEIIHKITFIFNMIILSSKFPRAWKMTKVIPIRKKSRSLDLNNLRPISILSALSKVFEKVLKIQIQTYLDNFNILNSNQSGFRKNHNTTSATVKVLDDILSVIDKKGKAFSVFIDFAKAFDRVSHVKLIQKLSLQFGFSSGATELLQNYLCNRKQVVFANGLFSDSASIISGVPQGSILGPLLFSLFINDLCSVLNHCRIHMFADDVQIYIASNRLSIPQMAQLLNEDLANIYDWSCSNLLPINSSKTKVMLFSRNSSEHQQPLIMLGQNVLEYVLKYPSLGFILKNDLEWDGHVNAQCRKIYIGLRTLKLSASMLPVNVKLKLFKSLLLPHFMYGDVLLLNASSASLNRLRVALNACVRFVYNLNRYSRVTHLQQELLGCPFKEFIKFRTCLTMFKIVNFSIPPYLADKIQIARSTRTRNLIIPRHSTTHYGNSFIVRGATIWNQLPNAIKNIQTIAGFRKECITWFRG